MFLIISVHNKYIIEYVCWHTIWLTFRREKTDTEGISNFVENSYSSEVKFVEKVFVQSETKVPYRIRETSYFSTLWIFSSLSLFCSILSCQTEKQIWQRIRLLEKERGIVCSVLCSYSLLNFLRKLPYLLLTGSSQWSSLKRFYFFFLTEASFFHSWSYRVWCHSTRC